MKIIVLPILVMLTSLTLGQISPQSYQVKENSASFDLNKLNVDMLDLYRGVDHDNEITLEEQGKKIVIVLLSAKKLKSLGLPFNEGLVQKGAMMVGPVSSGKKYRIELTTDKNLNFISSY